MPVFPYSYPCDLPCTIFTSGELLHVATAMDYYIIALFSLALYSSRLVVKYKLIGSSVYTDCMGVVAIQCLF